jgi:hypothetical protein
MACAASPPGRTSRQEALELLAGKGTDLERERCLRLPHAISASGVDTELDVGDAEACRLLGRQCVPAAGKLLQPDWDAEVVGDDALDQMSGPRALAQCACVVGQRLGK